MVSQITHCYSYNRQSVNPVKLYCTSFGDKTKAEFEDKKSDYQRWRRNEVIIKHLLIEIDFVLKNIIGY